MPAIKCAECGSWMEPSEGETESFYCPNCGASTADGMHDLLWQDMIDKMETGIYQIPQGFIDKSEELVRKDRAKLQALADAIKKPN